MPFSHAGLRGSGNSGEASPRGEVSGFAKLPRSLQPDLQHFPLPPAQVDTQIRPHLQISTGCVLRGRMG